MNVGWPAPFMITSGGRNVSGYEPTASTEETAITSNPFTSVTRRVKP